MNNTKCSRCKNYTMTNKKLCKCCRGLLKYYRDHTYNIKYKNHNVFDLMKQKTKGDIKI